MVVSVFALIITSAPGLIAAPGTCPDLAGRAEHSGLSRLRTNALARYTLPRKKTTAGGGCQPFVTSKT
jgi:hypothetical protein